MSVNDIRKEVTTELFEIKEGSSEFNATFVFGNEDHTLGNLLRFVLVSRKDVEFCGYSGKSIRWFNGSSPADYLASSSVPHPYEPKMNLRLQTIGVPAADVLRSGLHDITRLCDDVEGKYKAALAEYEQNA